MTWVFPKTVRVVAVRGTVLTAGLLAGAALAEPADKAVPTDVQLALQARSALWDQSPFDKLNLGVSVRDGVATVSGPLPSTAVAEQAIALLKAVPGIRSVVNDTYIPPADQALARSMPHPITARRPSVSVGPAVPRPEPVAPPPAVVAVAPVKQQVVNLGPTAAPPLKRMSLAEQIESLRLADRRFRTVRVEVRNGVVVLRGTIARSADAWEFAATVRQIPGVTDVIQSIETAGR